MQVYSFRAVSPYGDVLLSTAMSANSYEDAMKKAFEWWRGVQSSHAAPGCTLQVVRIN